MDSSGCWTKGGKYVAPESLLPYLAQQIHILGHSGPATMNHRFSNQWWNPKFRNAATETVKRCVTCQKNNDVPAATTPAAHTPAPPGPFRHLQVDYISLPPCKGKTDVLVVIDKFSRWVEAYPTGRATAAHTVTDFIPRWGLPDCIDSDQGTHFTGQVVKEVSRMLKIKWNLHCPYRPQASGQVERSNRTIKTRDAPVDRPKIGTGRFLLILRDRQPAGFCLFFGRFFRKCEHVICVEDIRQKHNTHRKTDTMKRTAVGVTLLAHK